MEFWVDCGGVEGCAFGAPLDDAFEDEPDDVDAPAAPLGGGGGDVPVAGALLGGASVLVAGLGGFF